MSGTLPVAHWTTDTFGCHIIQGRHCWIWIDSRPAYCDRGRWLAHIEVTDRRALHVDHQDGWPRYYFDFDRGRLECEAWLRIRKQIA